MLSRYPKHSNNRVANPIAIINPTRLCSWGVYFPLPRILFLITASNGFDALDVNYHPGTGSRNCNFLQSGPNPIFILQHSCDPVIRRMVRIMALPIGAISLVNLLRKMTSNPIDAPMGGSLSRDAAVQGKPESAQYCRGINRFCEEIDAIYSTAFGPGQQA